VGRQMIMLNRRKCLSLAYFTEHPYSFIKMVNDYGYECEYVTNGEIGTIKYPNYKEIDEMLCSYVGAETMVEINPDWEYYTRPPRK